MKRLLIIILLFISGCSFVKENNNIVVDDDIDENIDTSIKLGLYLYDDNNNKILLEDTYYTEFTSGVDIGTFEVSLTNGSDISNYKIGFNIKFILSDGTNFNTNYLDNDIYKFSEYFYVYLNEEDNLFTSIKISSGENIDKVENIILGVFAYESEDDFDSDGNYIGDSLYVIRIKKLLRVSS